MRGRGFEPHTKRMLNAGNLTPTTQHGRQEPTLLTPACNQIRLDFFHPQHTCAIPNGVGLLLSRILHAPFATGWDGANISLIKVRGKWVHTTLHTYFQLAGLLINFTNLVEYLLVHDAGVRTRALSLRAGALEWCARVNRTRDRSL